MIMKNLFNFSKLFLFVSIIISCQDESKEVDVINSVLIPESRDSQIQVPALTEFENLGSERVRSVITDASGQIQISIWTTKFGSAQHHNNRSVSVGSGYVCVGGGAWAEHSGSGGILTASYPGTDKKSWLASSKDHIKADSHFLHVYAVGMKINGISESQLKSYITHWSSTSGVTHYPASQISIPSNYELLGGGVRINWSGAGNLLVASRPLGTNTWYGLGKDHAISSPASITTYAIGMPRDIPNFGTVDTNIYQASAYTTTARDNVSIS